VNGNVMNVDFQSRLIPQLNTIWKGEKINIMMFIDPPTPASFGIQAIKKQLEKLQLDKQKETQNIQHIYEEKIQNLLGRYNEIIIISTVTTAFIS
jgi:hypothetical protein